MVMDPLRWCNAVFCKITSDQIREDKTYDGKVLFTEYHWGTVIADRESIHIWHPLVWTQLPIGRGVVFASRNA